MEWPNGLPCTSAGGRAVGGPDPPSRLSGRSGVWCKVRLQPRRVCRPVKARRPRRSRPPSAPCARAGAVDAGRASLAPRARHEWLKRLKGKPAPSAPPPRAGQSKPKKQHPDRHVRGIAVGIGIRRLTPAAPNGLRTGTAARDMTSATGRAGTQSQARLVSVATGGARADRATAAAGPVAGMRRREKWSASSTQPTPSWIAASRTSRRTPAPAG